jgi:hypothetical protein
LAPLENDLLAHYKALLAKEYKDPYIQVTAAPWPWWVPGIVLVKAVEHAYLNEDPVHMDRWIITPRDHVFRSWEFPLAFADLDRAPANAEEAIGAAKTAIFLENYQMNHGVIFSVDEARGRKIPPEILAQLHPPIIQEARGSYTVSIPAILVTSPEWGRRGTETSRLVLFRVIVAQGTCKILQETEKESSNQ